MAGFRWYALLLSGAGVMLLAAGVFLLTGGHPARPVADCGLVTCSASLPTASATGSALSQPPGRLSTSPAPPAARLRARAAHSRPPRGHPAATPGPARSPGRPAPSPSQPGPPPGTATVTYTVDLRWPGGFQGQFTIVNHGSTPLAGWVLAAVLPGDHITAVWSADYSTDGNTLTLTPASYQPVIPPGGSQSAFFTASGNTPEPTGCVFNKRACTG